MDRFLSKLDLRDIKIDPEGSSFPPDADELEIIEDSPVIVETPPVAVDNDVYQPWDGPLYRPTVPAASTNGHHEAVAEVEDAEEHEVVRPANGHDDVLKVSAKSRPSAVAGAIAGVVRESGRAEVQAIGAGATNQAVKAVAIAREYLRETGIDAVCLPAFIDVTIDNEDRTAIRLLIEPR